MNRPAQMLTVVDHNRTFVGLRYVYPVVSRRAKGVSVGINLNTNNACNWHCAYCQVPDLVRGAAPEVDMALLEQELRSFLKELVHGSFMTEHVPPEARTVKDIALSGNGEPTSSTAFPQVIDLAARLRDEYGLQSVPIRVISNGSLVDKEYVQAGLRRLGEVGGELWFKVDAGTPADIARINGVNLDPKVVSRRLRLAASLCPTWVQTCMFRWDGEAPSQSFLDAYCEVLKSAGCENLRGVLLYGVARQSMQEEALHLSSLTAAELEELADYIRQQTGLNVSVSP